ncbi:MAG: hypothetical protein V7637_3297 [Mycobacteriales bacterium]|jgi:hypothetical protein
MIPRLIDLQRHPAHEPFVTLFVWYNDNNWVKAQRAFNEVWGAERAFWESKNEALPDERITSSVINKLYVELRARWDDHRRPGQELMPN